MGSPSLLGMLEYLQSDTALIWHLQYNHYPPIPVIMKDVCKTAIDYANDGEWDVEVLLPEGCTWKGKQYAPVSAIIEEHHLEHFLTDEE